MTMYLNSDNHTKKRIIKSIQLLETRITDSEKIIQNIMNQYHDPQEVLTYEPMVKVIAEEELKITEFREEIERQRFELKKFE